MAIADLHGYPSGLWVFGYGSLIWNPDIEYTQSKIGYIRGYVRRFWQGNDTHRGTPQKLGRVATLVEDKSGVTWGRVFQLKDDSKTQQDSLANLNNRESKIGGYATEIVTFYPRDPKEAPFPVLIYVALPSNPFFLGPAPLPKIAEDIVECRGVCGHNVEYLMRLVNFMKDFLPNVWDDHLYLLEHLVRMRLNDKKIKVESLMGDKDYVIEDGLRDGDAEEPQQEGVIVPVAAQAVKPPSHFTSTVPSRKLRCLNM